MPSGLTSTALRLLSPAGRKGRIQIFTFHQVTDHESAKVNGAPTLEAFEAQIRWITDVCNVLPMGEAIELRTRDALPANAAVITFDDGYENNLTRALPILERYSAPATIFLATGALRDGIMWNDLFIEGIRRLRRSISFAYEDEPIEVSPDTPVERLLSRFKYEPISERWEAAQAFFRQATDESIPRLMLTEEQIAHCDTPLITFGAHTVSHPILAEMDDQSSRREIEQSKREVEELINQNVEFFAYPNGRYGQDFGEREKEYVAESGYRAAFTTDWGPVTYSSQCFALPRYAPWENSEAAYKRRILITNVSA